MQAVAIRRGRWWGDEKDIINLEITLDGPLIECADVTLSWASDSIPKNRANTFHVTGSFSRRVG